MDLEDIGWDSKDWIQVVHDKDYWQAVVVVLVVLVVVVVVVPAAYFRSNHTYLVAQFLFSRI